MNHIILPVKKLMVRPKPDQPDRFRRPCNELIFSQSIPNTTGCVKFRCQRIQHRSQIATKFVKRTLTNKGVVTLQVQMVLTTVTT